MTSSERVGTARLAREAEQTGQGRPATELRSRISVLCSRALASVQTHDLANVNLIAAAARAIAQTEFQPLSIRLAIVFGSTRC